MGQVPDKLRLAAGDLGLHLYPVRAQLPGIDRLYLREFLMKLSVCVVVYNQEKFLAQCLQSIVDQQTDFPFEIIVGDDMSTDNSRAVIAAFAARHPNIVPVLHERNMGGAHNYRAVHGRAQGDYIAHIDGDDVMLPGKLQAQVDVLDANPDCVACGHAMKVLRGETLIGTWKKYSRRKNGPADLLNTLPFFCHSSKMYRASLHSYRFVGDATLDVEVHFHDVLQGLIYYIDQELGIYRLNAGVSVGGSTLWPKPSPALEKGSRRVFAMASQHLPASVVQPALAKYLYELAYQYALAGEVGRYVELINESVATHRTGLMQTAMRLLAFLPQLAVTVARYRARQKGY